MARFQIRASMPIDELCIDSARYPTKVEINGVAQSVRPERKGVLLQLAGWEPSGKPYEIGTMNTDLIRVSVDSEDKSRRVTHFRVQPVSNAKGTAIIFARPQGGGPPVAQMTMTVGMVANQTGNSGGEYSTDLIAELARSEDPVKLWVYQRILSIRNNALPTRKEFNELLIAWNEQLKDQPLKQNTDLDANHWDCGLAASKFGTKYFGKSHFNQATVKLYNTPKTDKFHDLTFNEELVRSSVSRLNRLLDSGTAVEVFAVHADGFKFSKTTGEIQQTGATHFLTIVGRGPGDEYLATDPWPGGSRVNYTSGIFGNRESAFMGRLTFDGFRLGTPPFKLGAHDYLVLTGP
jgi:hypothetical protein